MTKKKCQHLSVYDLEGDLIDVIVRLQETLAKLQSEGYNQNKIEYTPEDRWDYARYTIESEKVAAS